MVVRHNRRLIYKVSLVALALLLTTSAVSCETTKRIVLRIDGEERIVETSASTVRDLLREQGITLGEWDRVEPPSWSELPRSSTVMVVRVREEKARTPIPFARQVVKDEALPEGEMRLLQAGKAGTLEYTYRVSFDGAHPLDRHLISQRVITESLPEIVAVGVSGRAASVPISGTIAYLANGNAWIIRHNSAERRPLTFTGDLDGRVLALSGDGQHLLFTRTTISGTIASSNELPPFNQLWLLDTRILQEEPRPLAAMNVIYAEWAGNGRAFAYSTADTTRSTPGWKARNDLTVVHLDDMTPEQILPPSAGQLYSWWGTRYAWSPDGTRFAYATAEAIGTIDVATGHEHPLTRFPAFHTYGEWVWVPKVSWSPDGRYLACVVHRAADSGEPEDSPFFDLAILDTENETQIILVPQVGMWADPIWSHPIADLYGVTRVALLYGVADVPTQSASSGYQLYMMDRDGSNRLRLQPATWTASASGVDAAWSPVSREIACIWRGDLYLINPDTLQSWPLTRGITCEKVQWSHAYWDATAGTGPS